MSFNNNDILVKAIQDALGTDEEGPNLISVARDAHKAEVELAAYLTGNKNLYMVVEDHVHGLTTMSLFSESHEALAKMSEIVHDVDNDEDITVSIRTMTINARE